MNKVCIPKLRFSGFDGEWKEVLLEDVAEFRKGKGISKSDIDENGILECIRYGELYTTYNELIQNVISKTNLPSKGLELSEYNDVIIPASGETQLDIATASCVLKSGVALSGDLNIIRSSLNGIFLSFYLNNKKKLEIAKLAQGSSVVHLYSSQLKTLKLNIPSLPEQQKIASFLSSVDEKIQQLSRKKELLEQYKKGVMQQLFSRKLRFKPAQSEVEGMNGKEYPDWEEKKLGDTLEITIDNRGKTPPTLAYGIPLLEVNSIGNKEIKYQVVSKFVTDETFHSWFRKYLKKGDVLFSTVGNTALCSYYDGKIKACIAQNIVGLRFKNDISLFMYYLLIEERNNNKFKQIEMGAVQPSVKVSQMVDLLFDIPCILEQQKIANFLSGIDDKIENTHQEINNMQGFKKGLLQQMFV